MSLRPWWFLDRDRHSKWIRVSFDLSPYTFIARNYCKDLDEDCGWMEPRTTLGRLLRALPLGTTMQGLPVAALWQVRHCLKS
jgi:hypothetical protein